MQPATVQRTLQSSGVLIEEAFGLSNEAPDVALMMSVLRDRMYTDKPQAVLREYFTNGWDAHIEAGKPTLPVEVNLPTIYENSLVIRDYGPGLSEKDMFGTYIKYMKSTKRTSNSQAGMYGLGAKSAFAYSDSFSITSYYQGTKKVYVAVLDPTMIGKLSKVFEGPTTETGIEVKVPVLPSDRNEFYRAARSLFPFAKPMPKFNIELDLPKLPEASARGFIQKEGIEGLPRWVALMGCVPYRIKFDQLQEVLAANQLSVVANKLYGALFFKIGEVDITPNREELEFTPRTKEAIVQTLKALNDEMMEALVASIQNAGVSEFEKRLLCLKHATETGLSIPTSLQDYKGGKVELIQITEVPDPNGSGQKTQRPSVDTFRMSAPVLDDTKRSYRSERRYRFDIGTREVEIEPGALFVIRDTVKPVDGYNFPKLSCVRVIHPTKADIPIKAIEVELRKAMTEARIQGIPIKRLSEFTYVPLSERRPGNSKYNHKYFQLDTSVLGFSKKGSDYWDPIPAREITSQDVFVILSHFEPLGTSTSELHSADRLLHHLFKEALPPIIGVRSTDTHYVKQDDLAGIPFRKWFYAHALEHYKRDTGGIQDIVESYYWRHGLHQADLPGSVVTKLQTHLGPDHPIPAFLTQLRQGAQKYNNRARLPNGNLWNEALGDLLRMLKFPTLDAIDLLILGVDSPDKAAPRLLELYERYPLLDASRQQHSQGFGVLEHDQGFPAYIDYIKLRDKHFGNP